MADRRGVRSASRHKTPTPQPPSRANTSQATRASRTRALRSASRDVEPVVEDQKQTRRSARQASITTATDDSEHEGQTTRKTRRKPAKAVVGDLTIVEEVDTQIEPPDAPGTPVLTQPEEMAPFRSPGAASEMSGTTAISSFSMVEAELLEPKYILKHLSKLCNSAQDFLEHLAPDNGGIQDDMHHIQEIQKPDSEFTQDYRDFNIELLVHLGHFRTEGNNYIHIRALHRTLFGLNGDVAAAQTGLDLVLFLTNLLVFAKQMIHSDRSEKVIWDALRQLDISFPSQFMRSLASNERGLLSLGESTLLNETFELALDLRTHLAILVLERRGSEDDFNPDEAVTEVFFRSEASQEAGGSVLRGWNTSALGNDDSALPPQFVDRVAARLDEMRSSYLHEDPSLDQRDTIDLEKLSADFPWQPTILRLLQWVRLRHRELSISIDEHGGARSILNNVKQEMERPQPVLDQPELDAATQRSPRRRRKSFGRDRRRSSRKFDPNAPVDLRAIDALKAKEKLSETEIPNVAQETLAEHEPDQLLPITATQQETFDLDRLETKPEHAAEESQDSVRVQLGDMVDEEVEVEEQDEDPAGPPTSSAAILKALKSVSKAGKENRTTSLFERQSNAVRVDFGDGFDTQATPGPSNQDKGKQRAQPSSVRKRARPVEIEEEMDDDDMFETEDRSANVRERRQQAPVAKKVRIDPSSSGAPPSHQPPPRSSRNTNNNVVQEFEQEDASLSETEAPDMTDTVPPPSTYQAQHDLALQNRYLLASQKERKPRTAWSTEEEEAFVEYMAQFPAKYAAILKHDGGLQGENLLQDRSQVNLKDKARTMAINMIKSGTGLKAGFENVIKPTTRDGGRLREQGYTW